MNGEMTKVQFNPRTDGLEEVRQIVFSRLRQEPDWHQFDYRGHGFANYVECADDHDSRETFLFLAHEVCWELIIQGVIAPGLDSMNPNLPFFHVTRYGKKVIAEEKYIPHDPGEYLQSLSQSIPSPDPTVMTYLTESLNCFTRGAMLAANLLLGIAAERAFLMVCESLEPALRNPQEKKALQKLLTQNPMKPKLDWVRQKMESIQNQKPRPLPEDVDLMLNGIYNFIRLQRNDLGHPKDQPPNVSREQVFVSLRLFASYYVTAESVRGFLASNQV
ncbi:MAG: hypothetical protein ACRD88_07040 [Terriglobia bacterium]